MTISLIIKNGTVVTPAGVLKTDIAIDGEKILGIGPETAFPSAERTIDALGKIVIPGGIDTHSHYEISFMGAQAAENWGQGTSAAAIGGTTTTIDFALQTPGQSLLDATKAQFQRAAELSVIDYSTKPLITQMDDLDQLTDGMAAVVDYGVPSFKGATIYTKAGWYENDWQLFSIMRKVKEVDGMITLHSENCLIGEGMQAELVKQGKTDTKYHGVAKPNFVEDMDIHKIMILAEELKTRTYVVHTTTRNGPSIIDSYRKKGLPVFCETCTHYLWLTDSTFEPTLPRGVMYMCSPPLRKPEDIEALWTGIKQGTVQTIGSDHLAFTKRQKEENSANFAGIPNGFPGSEVRLAVVFQEGVLKRGLSLQKYAEVVSTNAAKLFGFYPKKGVIAPGTDADITIIDPERKHSLNAADLHMGTDLSVYEGLEVTGWPAATILRGQVIAENDVFTGQLGYGEFVKGKLDDAVMSTV